MKDQLEEMQRVLMQRQESAQMESGCPDSAMLRLLEGEEPAEVRVPAQEPIA